MIQTLQQSAAGGVVKGAFTIALSLDGAVLAAIVDVVCTPERTQRLARRHHWPPTAEVISAWRNFILRDHEVGRTYALHLIDHVDVHAERIVIVPKVAGGRKELARLAASA